MKEVRIEEVAVGAKQNYEFTKDKWIVSDCKYGEIVMVDNNPWIVVEIKE
jgi:hypothetical protein